MLNRIAPMLLAATGTMAIATSAQAQNTASGAANDTGNAPIIVTARRQEEALGDVPASITVFTQDQLENADIQRAEDFISLTPGVTIVTNTAEAGDSQINIRGINGTRDAESSVALVVDGILRTNTAALNQDQGTLRQVEILKGPQGALYGRNAAAGAIVISTVRPDDYFEGQFRTSYGEQNTWTANGYVAGPITDGIGFVLSGDYRTTDGFYDNLLTGEETVDDQEVWNVNGRIVAEIGPDTELDFKIRYGELSGASINFNAAFHLPNFAGANPAFFEDVNEHEFRYYNNIRPTNDQQTFETSLKLEHSFGDIDLTAWVQYSNIENSLTADGTSADFARYISAALAPPGVAVTPDSLAASNACFASTAALTGFPVNQPGNIGQIPVPFIFAPANGSTFGPYSPTTCDGTQYQERNQEDISAEVRLSGSAGILDWQVGAYYLHINREVGVSLGADLGQGIIPNLFNPAGSSNPTSQLFNDDFSTDVYAAFGSLEAEVTNGLTLSAAVRYDIEDRSVNNLVPNVLDPITGAPINPGQAFGPIGPQDASFDQIQPRLSFNYALTDELNFYGTWGIGFKSGGFNNQGSAAIVDQNFNQFLGTNILINDQFRRERSSAFEVGLRGSGWDGRLTFDLAGYYTEVDDMQFFEFFVGAFGLLRVVSNIDEVEVYGLEMNANVEIVPGWDVYGAFNFTESEIKQNASRPYTVGNESPYTADYTINIGTQILAPLSDNYDLLLRADYRITGPTWFHTVQDDIGPTLFSGLLPGSALALPAFVGDADLSVAQRDEFSVMNLRAGIQGENWRLIFFADNLFDARYPAEVIPAVEFGGSFISPGQRRRFGVEAGVSF